jgi:hypothetical protein
MLLTLLNMPVVIFGPVMGLGILVGAAVYWRTPAGQSPAQWLYGMVRYKIGPSTYRWKPVVADGGTIQVGENSTMEAPAPEETQEEEGIIGDDNTIENIDFKAVHNDGMVETEQLFCLLIEVTERQWLILDSESRQAVIDSYSQFLMGIKSPIQTFTLPVPYRAEEYTDNIRQSNQHAPPGESRVLEYGRMQHAQWLENVVELGNIRDRRHFVMVTAYKDPDMEEDSGGGFVEGLMPTSPGGVGQDVDREKRYDQLWSRAQSVTSALPRTGADTEILRDRQEVLKTFYYYYKSRDAPEKFDHGGVTQAENGTTGGNAVSIR